MATFRGCGHAGLFHVFSPMCASPIATVLSDSCACGRVYWSSSSRSSSWYSASPPRDFHQGLSDLPVAGIRLLGLLRLGLVLFCFLFSCLDIRLRLLWFRPALSRSLGSLGLILGLVLVLR